MPLFRGTRKLFAAAVLLSATVSSGCSTEEIIGGTIGATILGGSSPSHEIQQIYYLGAFDPQGQLPPTVYRIRVHGQASFISFVKFASGWVPAPFIDSLTAEAGFKSAKSTSVQIDQGASETLSELTTGRRLMLFGPEGFREAPRNHRLVVVMGSDPSGFFAAIDQAVGEIAQLQAAQRQRDEAKQQSRGELGNDLVRALVHLRDERGELDRLSREIAAQTDAGGGS